MSVRKKRSISVPPGLDAEIEAEAARVGMTYSGWLTHAASNELKARAGLVAVAEVEEQLGGFTSEEIATADEWARKAIAHSRRVASRTRHAA